MSTDVTFGDGGFFMYAVLIWGIALGVGALAQILAARERDFSPVLWGGVVALVSIGILGSALGLTMGMSAVSAAPADQIQPMSAQVVAIAPLPTALAAGIAVPDAILVGIAAAVARRRARATSA